MGRVLSATDLSPCSLHAVRRAGQLATRLGWEHDVVHVVDEAVVKSLSTALNTKAADIRADVERERTQELQQALSSAGIGPHTLTVMTGRASSALSDLVNRSRPDLLVVGRIGADGFSQGTVASALVRRSRVPVLLVSEEESGGPYDDVLAGTDFSSSADDAARAGLAVSGPAATIRLLHVFDPPWKHLHYRSPTPASPEFRRDYTHTLEQHLKRAAASLQGDAPGRQVVSALVEGMNYAQGIVAQVAALEPDLLVLGTRGRTDLRDIFLGSTAERVLREVTCSCLAVPPRAG